MAQTNKFNLSTCNASEILAAFYLHDEYAPTGRRDEELVAILTGRHEDLARALSGVFKAGDYGAFKELVESYFPPLEEGHPYDFNTLFLLKRMVNETDSLAEFRTALAETPSC
jgi:hypothetical protein